MVLALELPHGLNFAHFLCLSREDSLLVCASPRSSSDCSPLLPRLRLLRRLCLRRLSGYQQEFPVLCLQSESVQSRNKDTSWYYDFSEPIEQQDRARVSNAANPALSRALCQLV